MVHRITARSEEQERWLTETADALASAEQLAARLVELRGTSDVSAVLAIQAEIAVLRHRVEELERANRGRRDYDPNWTSQSAWGSSGAA